MELIVKCKLLFFLDTTPCQRDRFWRRACHNHFVVFAVQENTCVQAFESVREQKLGHYNTPMQASVRDSGRKGRATHLLGCACP